MTTSPINRNSIAKRRSPRMALKAPVGLSGQDREKCSFALSAKATNLNRHGGAVQLKRELSVGSMVELRNNRGTKDVRPRRYASERGGGTLHLRDRVGGR